MSSEQQKKSLIYLAGFMGSGKSTIGPILANTLGYEFVDIDKLIEVKAGKRISEIFETEGEQVFRALEREMLIEVGNKSQHVIALGGGTIANEENFQLAHQSGIIVYLQLSPEEIQQRVQHRNDRPMLKDQNGKLLPPDLMAQRIRDLLTKREQFYLRADIILPAENQRVGVTVDKLVKQLRGLIK